MAIRFLCPLGHRLAVAEHLAGKKGRCPVCKQRVYIPDLDPASAPPLDDAEERAQGGPVDVFVVDEAPPEVFAQAASVPVAAAVGGMPQPAPQFTYPPAPEFRPAIAEHPPAAEGYQADPQRVQTVYFLAVALAMISIFSVLPALPHLNLVQAPGWARIMLLLAALQLAYIVWIVLLPDWSTVWVGMLVFSIVGSIYAVAMAVVLFTPQQSPLLLGLDADTRRTAIGWCCAVVLLTTLASYICGRISARWRRSYELTKARRHPIAHSY